MNIKYILFVILILIGLESCCSSKPVIVQTTDTIYVDKKIPDVKIDSIKPKTVIVKEYYPIWDTTIVIDTVHLKGEIIYRTKAYTAIVDTVVANDTIYFKYQFPTNEVRDLAIKHKPIHVPVTVNNKMMQAVDPFPKWLIYLLLASTTSVGFYIGYKLGENK